MIVFRNVTVTSKPAQGFLMEAAQNGYSNPTTTTNNSNTNTVDAIAFRFNMHRYPIMDVTTVSEANNAMLYQYDKHAFEQVGGRGTFSSLNLSPRQEGQVTELQHRILDGSLQHRNNGTLTGSLSVDGHEHEQSLKV